MNCKNLKIKLNHKLECKLTGKIITWDQCKNCKLREYDVSNKIKTIEKKKRSTPTITPKIRNVVNLRDNCTCRLCGKPSVHLHHIIYRSESRELINDPDNLICLCLECHNLVHSNKKKYQPILKKIICNIKKELHDS